MNRAPLQPKTDEHIFLKMFTRPSPLPPEGLQLSVMEVCHLRIPQKKDVFPLQEAYFSTLVWGVSGQFSIYINNQKHSVRGNEFMLLEPGGVFRVDADQEDNHCYYLLLDGSQAKTIARECGLWTGTFPYTRSPEIWLERIASDINDLKKQEYLVSTSHSLLVSAFQDASQCAPDKMVWDACCYLQKNWNQPGMNVETVLSHFDVSRSTLSPRFRKITGETILDYLMDIRYRNALKMLRYDYETISKIAQRCGFSNASSFSTWFRKRNGASPRTVKMKIAQ